MMSMPMQKPGNYVNGIKTDTLPRMVFILKNRNRSWKAISIF